jgi:aspartyl-tRNA(Asn)/glutamyl-tRNA(Gln) amidotransferase subunit B
VPDGKGGAYEKVVNLTRAHLEEDAGKSLHEDFHGMTGIDLNRAGTPLLEIVSEPDMRSSAEAVAYAKALHALVRWIDICDGNMQEGSFRCDANVSCAAPATVRHAARDQEPQQLPLHAAGDRLRNPVADRTDRGRGTGSSRPPCCSTRTPAKPAPCAARKTPTTTATSPTPTCCRWSSPADWIERVGALPELPVALSARFRPTTACRLRRRHPDRQPRNGRSTTSSAGGRRRRANAKPAPTGSWANWPRASTAKSGHRRLARSAPRSSPAWWRASPTAPFQQHRQEGLRGAVERRGPGSADAIIEAQGLKQVTDSGAIEPIIDEVLAANPKSVEEFRAGKEKAFNALVGQCMKASKGKANPAQVNELLKKKLAPEPAPGRPEPAHLQIMVRSEPPSPPS